MEILQWEPRLIEIQHLLSKNDYFSRGPLPGYADAVIFKILLQNRKYPDKKSYPYFYHWYVIMKQFSINSIEKWRKQKLYEDVQSEKMIQLVSQIFIRNTNSTNINKSLSGVKNIISQNDENYPMNMKKPVDKAKNQSKNSPKKIEYAMIIRLKTVQNLQKISNKLYSLRIKIKQLKFNKVEKLVLMRFSCDKEIFQTYKSEVSGWQEVDSIMCKKLIPKPGHQNQAHPTKTTSFRS